MQIHSFLMIGQSNMASRFSHSPVMKYCPARHNGFEHMRPMLVKFPLSRSFGTCKAISLASPCKNI